MGSRAARKGRYLTLGGRLDLTRRAHAIDRVGKVISVQHVDRLRVATPICRADRWNDFSDEDRMRFEEWLRTTTVSWHFGVRFLIE
jgi:hypothetical protein